MEKGLRFSGIPLGGLGAGSFELRADGYFHEWQIMNNAPWGAGPEVVAPADAGFFGIHINGGADLQRTLVLGACPAYGRLTNNPYHQPWLQHAERIDCDTRFPFTFLQYRYGDAAPDQEPDPPIEISLEAFSPFIPLDAKHSALPLAYFKFNLHNLKPQTFRISLFQAQRNLTGYTSRHRFSAQAFDTRNNRAWLVFTREDMDDDASDRGELLIGAFGHHKVALSYCAHPRTDRDVWEALIKTGQLDNADHGRYEGVVGNEGEGGRGEWVRLNMPFGALCQTITLPPLGHETLIFMLAWYFPNMWERNYAARQCEPSRIGHQYNTWFDSAAAVFHYGADRFSDLYSDTHRFSDAYYQSSLPKWKLDAVNAQCTTLVKSSWWDDQGRFGIWEGLGCCGLQTTDITHYASFPIVLWFPELQKSQMRLTVANMEREGRIPHMMPGTFACCDVDRKNRIDLIPQFVLLVWRDVLWSGDMEYAWDMWPVVKQALNYFMTFDTDGDGLPNNTGPDQTYDQFPLKGTSSFVGFLYAGALHAAAQLGDILSDKAIAKTYAKLKDKALSELESQLWNNEYYRLCHDPINDSNDEGVMADQVNADWFIRQTTGEGLLSLSKVRATLKAVIKHCRRNGFLANCAWPNGTPVEIGRHTSDQANTPWSGVEYAVAAHCLLTNLEKEGWCIFEDVWQRYERAGLRFNHIECGEHYYRALSSWAVYLAWQDFSWDAFSSTLGIRIRRENTRFVICLPTGWGLFETNPEERLLAGQVRKGSMTLANLLLKGISRDEDIKVYTTDEEIDIRTEECMDGIQIEFAKSVVLKAGMSLAVEVDQGFKEEEADEEQNADEADTD